MKLKIGTIVQEIGPNKEYASKWEVVKLSQSARHRTSYLARNAREDLDNHYGILTLCRYNKKLVGNQSYVDNMRRRLLHEAKMLTIPHNVLPEPMDLFQIENTQDRFSFPGGDRYQNSEPVLVTESYHGKPIDTLVKEDGLLGERRALSLGLKLSELLGDLHQRKVLVYELRPEDILVDDTDHDRLWLVGCANFQHMDKNRRVRRKDMVVPLSDFSFTAPEVEAGQEPLDVRADIYSFGAMLLYMLTGKQASDFLRGDDSYQAVYGLRHCSYETCRLLSRCMATLPEERFRNFEEIRPVLQEALARLQQPPPPCIEGVTVQRDGDRHLIGWQLPAGWTSDWGVWVGRWSSRTGQPHDLAFWDVLLDEMPSAVEQVIDDAPAPDETVHYAVMAQAPYDGQRRLSLPTFATIRTASSPPVADVLVGLFASPWLLLYGIGILFGHSVRGVFRWGAGVLGSLRNAETKPKASKAAPAVLSAIVPRWLRWAILLLFLLIPVFAAVLVTPLTSSMTAMVHGGQKVLQAMVPYRDFNAAPAGGWLTLLTAGLLWVARGSPHVLHVLMLAWLWTGVLCLWGLARRLVGARGSWAAAALFAVTVSALGIATDGQHPTQLILTPMLLPPLALATFIDDQKLWQPTLAGLLAVVSVALEPITIGSAVVLGAYLWVMGRQAALNPRQAYRGLGAYIGGLALATSGIIAGAIKSGVSLKAWLVQTGHHVLHTWRAPVWAPLTESWGHTVLAFTPIVILALTAWPSLPKAEGERADGRRPLVHLWLLGVTLGLLAGGRFGPQYLALLAAPLVVRATWRIQRSLEHPTQLADAWPGWLAIPALALPLYLNGLFIVSHVSDWLKGH